MGIRRPSEINRQAYPEKALKFNVGIDRNSPRHYSLLDRKFAWVHRIQFSGEKKYKIIHFQHGYIIALLTAIAFVDKREF